MRLLLLISVSLLWCAAQKVCAQLAPANDFFNSGAQLYISNNIPAALERVESGLQLYPDDEPLKKLEALLKQQQSQQNQPDQSQQQKSDSQKNQQQKADSKDQQKPDEPKKSQADQKKDEAQKQSEPSKTSPQKPADGKQENADAGEPSAKPGQMTPEEAKHLLDAQKDDEQVLKLQPKDKPQDPNRPVKDW